MKEGTLTNADKDDADSSAPASTWVDRKRHLWLLGLLVPSLAFVAIGGFALTGWGVWLWTGPIVILGVVPVVDLVTGVDRSSPPDEVIAALEADRYYRWLTYAYLPIQYAGFVLALWVIARWDLSTVDKVGLAVTMGFVAGIGISTAHELGHKRESVERWMAKIALAQSGYGHFYIEHNRGHHVRVATPEDPASSRLGESFYAFWPRTVLGSARHAWRLESRRLARRHEHPFRVGNDVLNAWLMSVVLWLVMVAWLGAAVLPYLALQAVIGFTLLEIVNYLEHYGMLRQRGGAPGSERYERVDPTHSWNANQIATNVLLYHLQRHSDHHANPTRRYQALRDYPDAPQLPTGYAGMLLIALIPPLWFRVMDPRVLAHYDGDVTRANLSPRRRARLTAPALTATPPGGVLADVADGREHGGQPAAADAYACPGCGYSYAPVRGDAREGFPAGTSWSAVPAAWCCPDCGVRDKADFIPVSDGHA